jgi:hypothetical protein
MDKIIVTFGLIIFAVLLTSKWVWLFLGCCFLIFSFAGGRGVVGVLGVIILVAVVSIFFVVEGQPVLAQ